MSISKKKIKTVNIRMLSVRFALMEIIQMITLSYFVVCAISVSIKDVLDLQKCQLKAGFVIFA
jgi:hypothetical protein